MNALESWINALLQAILFLLLPFLWWVATARREVRFLPWLGWRSPESKHPWLLVALMAGAFLVFLMPGLWIAPQLGSNVAASQFHGRGWAGLPAVVAQAVVQTAFAEESLFRGFILKRLMSPLGLRRANLVQGVLFGAVHAIPFTILAGAVWGLSIGLLTAAVGLALGYVNEEFAAGSLMPSWALHSAANLTIGCLALVGAV